MTFYDRILKLDRRWIYLAVLIAVIWPLLKPIGLPIAISPPSQAIFDRIDSLEPGNTVLIAMDFDPSSKPELYPMTLALMRHCFAKDLKIIANTMWVTGAALGEEAMSTVAKEFDKENGVDYCYLGYKAGNAIVIVSMGESIKNTYPTDYYGKATNTLPIFDKVDKLHELDFMVDLAAGATVETWIAYGKERYIFEMGAGCTAVSATQYYPFLDTGQIIGLLGGLKGAAEYEKMIVDAGYVEVPGKATAGMDAQSIVHLMTVIIVILANILYLLQRSVKVKEED